MAFHHNLKEMLPIVAETRTEVCLKRVYRGKTQLIWASKAEVSIESPMVEQRR
jgi:hypothetical protein